MPGVVLHTSFVTESHMNKTRGMEKTKKQQNLRQRNIFEFTKKPTQTEGIPNIRADNDPTCSQCPIATELPEESGTPLRKRQSEDLWSSGKRKKTYKYNPAWENEFLVAVADDANSMICMICGYKMTQLKKDNAKKHLTRAHDNLSMMTEAEKCVIIDKFKKSKKTAQCQMKDFLGPQKLINLVPYKLAYTLAKHKLPFSHAEVFMEFAKVADPTSEIFQKASKSRRTVTRRLEEIYEKVLQPELREGLDEALFFSYAVDECLDKGTSEQLAIFVRYIDLEHEEIVMKLLSYEEVRGSPNAENLFQCLKRAFEREKVPTEKIIGHTSDNAKVVISELNGLAAKVRNQYNDDLYVQKCVTHTEVLVAKDGQKLIPVFVEQTLKKVLDFFRYSSAKKSKFEDLLHLQEKYVNLIKYHRVRWLSMQACVDRVLELLPELIQFFEAEQHNKAISKAERKRCEDLYNALCNHEFLLYICFLDGQLRMLCEINKQLQMRNQTLYETYRKIFMFMRLFVSSVLKNDALPLEKLMEHENLIDISNHDIQDPPTFGCHKFHQYWLECVEQSHLEERKLRKILSTCITYITVIGRSFLTRFPEYDFVLQHCQIMEPSKRSHDMEKSVLKVLDRFSAQNFEKVKVLQAYKLYRFDEALDHLYQERCGGNLVKFACQLYRMQGYKDFAKVLLLLLSIQPDTCEVERSFSCMNYVKNEYRSCLSSEHLNAAVSIALDGRSLQNFPLEKCFK